MILNRLGKKTKLAAELQEYFPEHTTYVEPFMGAGGMYFNKKKAKYNILNDNDSNVFHLYQTLKKNPKKLAASFLDMPKHQDMLRWCKKTKPQGVYDKTNCFLMASNMTFLGKGSTLRYGNTNERRDFLKKANATYDYLKDAQFMNKDFRKVIASIADREKPKTFVYADPPYVGTDSNYEDKSWKPQDLDDLMRELKNSKVKFGISEFKGKEVLRLAKKHRLKVIEIGERRNLNNRRTEVLIVNYDAKKQKQINTKHQLLKIPNKLIKQQKKGVNVLSLFDGISAGQVGLKKAKVKVNKYYASEIDNKAIEVTQRNFPETIQLGDVTKLKGEDIEDDIDVLIGGSPCQGFSMAGNKLNFKDPRSKLFFEFVRLKKTKKPKYFLFENVQMNKQSEDIISRSLGVKPIKINSSKLSAQNRDRLYWTNIPNIEEVIDKGITLDQIVPDGTDCKRTKFSHKGWDFEYNPKKKSKQGTKNIGNWSKSNRDQSARIYSTCGGKSPAITASANGIHIVTKKGKVRKLKPKELEKLQNLPEGYTEGLSDYRREVLLGNGFTADVIAHLAKPIAEEQKKEAKQKPRKKIKQTKKVAFMEAPALKKKWNRGKIIRNVAIGGVGLFLLTRAIKANGQTSNPTTNPNENPPPMDGIKTIFKNAMEANFESFNSLQNQVFDEIINAWEVWGDGDLQKLAYILATGWHESFKFEYLTEIRAKEGTALYETQNKYWFTGFYGRGIVQLTHESNYRKMSNFLGVDLVSNPSLAEDPYYAGQIIVYGMLNGSFTGAPLSRYINGSKQDFYNARRTVNGTDKANLIKGYTQQIINSAINLNA